MKLTRRALLASTALSYSRILGANERLRVGGLGTGGRGRYVLGLAKEHLGAEIVALSDVRPTRILEARKLLSPQAAIVPDWRTLLERQDLDAVVIGSPDHWHVPMAVAALNAGRHVYLEKPVSHTVEEGALLVEAARRSKAVFQAGYQQRSIPHFAEARELIRAGKLGKVALVQTWWNQDFLTASKPTVDPNDIDWDAFLGTAPPRPFDPLRVAQWRFYWDYGGGTVTDLFSHWIDSVHWLLDDAQPLAATGVGRKEHVKHWDCPDTVSGGVTYSKGHVVNYTSAMVTRLTDGGIVFVGTEASMKLTRSGFSIASDASSLAQKSFEPTPDQTSQAKREGTIDHVLNWAAAIREGKPANSDAASAVASANAAHYLNHAIRTGRNLQLPPRTGGWRKLFDGKTLRGWIPYDKEMWSVRDGMIVGRHYGSKKNEFLRSEEQFGDFELKLKFRLAGGAGNSGVQFRSMPAPDPWEVSGYQADAGEKYWGCLYDESRRNKVLASPEAEMLVDLDTNAWNEYIIRAEGRHIVLKLNGTQVVDYEELEQAIPQKGFLALQIHSGLAAMVQFRDIEVREIY